MLWEHKTGLYLAVVPRHSSALCVYVAQTFSTSYRNKFPHAYAEAFCFHYEAIGLQESASVCVCV